MLDPALVIRWKLLVAAVVGLLFAVFLGTEIGGGNYIYLTFELGAILIAAVASFSGGYFWVAAIASTFLGGQFPILQGQFTPFHIFVGVAVVRFVITDVVLKRTRVNFGSRFDMWMIVAFMSILLVHGLHDRFGMRFFGSNIWGGKYYVNVLVGLAAFFVIQSAEIQPKVWSALPYAILAVATFDLFISLITTFLPRAIFVIYPFYSAVSTLGMEDIFGSREFDLTERISAYGNFGFILTVFVLSFVSVREIFSPSRLGSLLAVAMGFVASLYSGFRGAAVNTGLTWCAAAIRDFRWAVLFVLPLFVAGLFSLSFINAQIVGLPKQVQRSLSFLPGEWDPDMLADANASNDFRSNTWSLWRQEYFPAQPWFGRGFGFRRQWATQSVYIDTGSDYKMNVEVGNLHNGLFAAVDALGIIGAAFFIGWSVSLLFRIFRKTNASHGSTALRFIGLCLAVYILSYWGGALNLGTFLPQELALAAVFLRLQRELAVKPVPIRARQSTVASETAERFAHA